MEHKSARQKKEIMTRIRAFSHCGLSCKLSSNISYFKSFVGRDFKALMHSYLSHISIKQKKNAGFFFPKLIYKCLTLITTVQVFCLCYCVPFSVKDITHWKTVCNEFVKRTAKYMPEFSKRLKTHLVLYLVDSIINFGPTQCYNTERHANESLHFYHQKFRYESFNSLIRTQNVFGNKQSPSKDIAHNFAIIQHLRYICSGGPFSNGQR